MYAVYKYLFFSVCPSYLLSFANIPTYLFVASKNGNRETTALTIIKTHLSYYRCELPQTFWELASWYTFFPEK